ncbi:hypothetical protein [Paenibacillus sp. sgz500958]|uniref:hypothetical protein n=1 Tax=Paenibacillus sp. sgz500958 TaxID=3242475 RepID=UPI0036D3B392
MSVAVNADFEGIRRWIYRNARPLDLARWKYHCESGSPEAVVEALSAYQNQDGGFGHALEADSWNPASTPIQTTTAIEKLLEIHFEDKLHPLVQGILKYLDSGADVVEGRWLNTVLSNNDYPHAPWWHTDSDSTARSEYNPSAIIAGFILKFADRSTPLYARGLEVAQELAERFMSNSVLEMHPLKCFVTLLELIPQAGLQNEFPYSELQEAAVRQAGMLIVRDAQNWEGYGCRPSAFVHSPASPFYTGNEILLEQELEYLSSSKNEAGVWNITWSWAAYEKQFAISENWWKAEVAINNVRLLRAFGRI